jgi:hypothetical protein
MKKLLKILKIAGISIGGLFIFLCIIAVVTAPKTPLTNVKVASKPKVVAKALTPSTNVKVASKPKVVAKALTPAQIAAQKKAAAFKIYLAKQQAQYTAFITWYNSQVNPNTYECASLDSLVKANLNDASSFQFVSATTDVDINSTYFTIKMVYRAKNEFGAYILQNVSAKAVMSTNEITITGQNN